MAKAKAKEQAAATLTYIGDSDSVTLGEGRYYLARGEAVEVDVDMAKRFADNPYFEATGVTTDDPVASVTAEDALAAERAQAAADLAAAKDEYTKQLQANADALKAGWEEQHAADQAEIARLTALLNAPAPTPPVDTPPVDADAKPAEDEAK